MAPSLLPLRIGQPGFRITPIKPEGGRYLPKKLRARSRECGSTNGSTSLWYQLWWPLRSGITHEHWRRGNGVGRRAWGRGKTSETGGKHVRSLVILGQLQRSPPAYKMLAHGSQPNSHSTGPQPANSKRTLERFTLNAAPLLRSSSASPCWAHCSSVPDRGYWHLFRIIMVPSELIIVKILVKHASNHVDR